VTSCLPRSGQADRTLPALVTVRTPRDHEDGVDRTDRWTGACHPAVVMNRVGAKHKTQRCPDFGADYVILSSRYSLWIQACLG
jgi:hypothetical protein